MGGFILRGVASLTHMYSNGASIHNRVDEFDFRDN